MELEQFNIPRFLAVLPLFSDLSPADLARMAGGCDLKRLNRGDTIFRYGEPCEEFHVVVTGQIKLFALSQAGQEKVIELVGPGHSFAEALMFTGKPYILNAQALTGTLLLSVGKQVILNEIQLDPRFSMRMLAGISRRLHGLVHDVQAYALQSGVQRVVGYLLQHCPQSDGACEGSFDISLPTSKQVIASRLNLTPETLSRIFHELSDSGLISVQGKHIVIHDAARLAEHD